MEAYETPVMEVVEIEDELVIVTSCTEVSNGAAFNRINDREESL